MEITRETKTTISECWDVSDEESRRITVTVDHEDPKAPIAFEAIGGFCSGDWASLEALQKLKKVVDKALRIYKEGPPRD